MTHITKTIRIEKGLYDKMADLYPMATFTKIAEKAFTEMVERETGKAAPAKVSAGNSSNEQRKKEAREKMIKMLKTLTSEQIEQAKAEKYPIAAVGAILGVSKSVYSKQKHLIKEFLGL